MLGSIPPRRILQGRRLQSSGEGKRLDAGGLVRYYEDLVAAIDRVDRGRHGGGRLGRRAELTKAIGKKIQLVGDDVFVPTPKRLADGIAKGVANSSW